MYSINYIYLKKNRKMSNNRWFSMLILSVIVLALGFVVFLDFRSPKNMELSTEATSSLKGLGCLMNNNKLQKEHMFQFTKNSCGISVMNNTTLSSYSLEDYLPEIGDQGDVGSCVGWATAYYGLTIVKRLEHGKDYPAFSPLSVFNRFCYLKKFDPCNGGSYIDGCLSLLVTKGCPLVEEYDKPNCSVDANTKRYNDCLFSFERLQQNNVNQLKLSLANNCPVVIGLEVFQGGLGNTLNSKFLDSNGVAKMEIFRNSRYPVGGHALCIVGYDDQLGGGAFKIANSWGKNWGKSGFFWLRYRDLDMVRCAYSLMPNSLLINKETKFLFKTLALSITNETAKNQYVAVGYEVNQGIETKGWFLIEAGMSRVINIAPRKSNSVYYITMDENGTIQDGSDKSLSLKMKSFDISASDEANSEVSKHAFSLWIPSNKKQIQAMKITGSSKVQLSEN